MRMILKDINLLFIIFQYLQELAVLRSHFSTIFLHFLKSHYDLQF